MTSLPRAARSGAAVLLLIGALAAGCRPHAQDARPAIEFTKVPPADKGGPDTMDVIQGRVTGARPGQRIVLFSRSRVWWVQPAPSEPFTSIHADTRWSGSTHLGTEYAALLVDGAYQPPASTETLPQEGAGVIAVATVPGNPNARASHHSLRFAGYEWRVRAAPSDRGGHNVYDPSNAWTDERGALHLRIAGAPGRWSCAEVSLTRRLGYGTYRFVVRDVSELEPAAVLGIFTWDGPAADHNHRELDIEISRWGDPEAKNAQFVVQPYYIGANVAKFTAPPGVLTHSLRWEPGRASFRTVRGDVPVTARGAALVAEHVFTSGVPPSGNETVRMNLYAFSRSARPLARGAEVVIEKFEYLP